MFKTAEQYKGAMKQGQAEKEHGLPDLLVTVMKCRTFYLDNRATEMKPVHLQFPFKAKIKVTYYYVIKQI